MEQYILYGMGNEHYHRRERCLQMIAAVSAPPPFDGVILYDCDANPRLWNEDKKIFPPEKILNNPEATVIIGCMPVEEVVKNLRKLGCKNKFLVYPFFGWFFYCNEDIPENISEVNKIVNDWIFLNKNELLSIYDLEDAETKTLLNELIAERSMPKLNFIELERMINFKWQPYFEDEKIIPLTDITLVDGGAFTGDSIEMVYKRFGSHLKKIYAFEPNEENLKQMTINLKKLGLNDSTQYVPFGMYDKNTELHFSAQADKGRIEENGKVVISVKSIDSVIKDVKGTLCIKMDIEGSELAALRGAKETILKYQPYMAICTYHKMADILEIPKYIKSIREDYNFYLRAGFHTECYAVPKFN